MFASCIRSLKRSSTLMHTASGFRARLSRKIDDAAVGLGGFRDRIKVLFQLRGRAEEELAFQADKCECGCTARPCGMRSRTTRSGVMINSVQWTRAACGTYSTKDRNTPINTQNSTETATAETAVSITIQASNRVVRR